MLLAMQGSTGGYWLCQARHYKCIRGHTPGWPARQTELQGTAGVLSTHGSKALPSALAAGQSCHPQLLFLIQYMGFAQGWPLFAHPHLPRVGAKWSVAIRWSDICSHWDTATGTVVSPPWENHDPQLDK